MPPTFSHYIQRAGRAARGKGQTGVAILLVEKSAYTTDIVSAPAPSTDSKEAKKKAGDASQPKRTAKQVREYALAHGSVRGGWQKQDDTPDGPQPLLNPDSADEGLLTLIQSATCRRKVWAEVFNSSLTGTPSLCNVRIILMFDPLYLQFPEPVVPCCDICDPTLLDLFRPPRPPPERKQKSFRRGLPDLNAQQELRRWRKQVYERDHSHAQYDSSAILPDDLIGTLTSSLGPLTSSRIADLIGDKWIFWPKYGAEISEVLASRINVKVVPLPPKPRAGKRNVSAIEILLAPSDSSKRLRMVESLSEPHAIMPGTSGVPLTVGTDVDFVPQPSRPHSSLSDPHTRMGAPPHTPFPSMQLRYPVAHPIPSLHSIAGRTGQPLPSSDGCSSAFTFHMRPPPPPPPAASTSHLHYSAPPYPPPSHPPPSHPPPSHAPPSRVFSALSHASSIQLHGALACSPLPAMFASPGYSYPSANATPARHGTPASNMTYGYSRMASAPYYSPPPNVQAARSPDMVRDSPYDVHATPTPAPRYSQHAAAPHPPLSSAPQHESSSSSGYTYHYHHS